jgi:hypothetical protein
MLTYLLGPFFSILPKQWRKLLPFHDDVQWGPATVISGLAEAVAALLALSHWYSVAMTAWIAHGVDSALAGKVGPGVTPQEIGSVALVVWASHPLTWLLGYFGVEGMARLCAAAFAESTPSMLPLFLLDKIFFGAFRRRGSDLTGANDRSPGNVASMASAVRERFLVAKTPLVPDELSVSNNASEEILEVRTCHRKEGWTPPRVVRYQDNYYRLETDSLGAGPRPFRYTLRRLSAGVPGRSVLLYAPEDAVVLAKR